MQTRWKEHGTSCHDAKSHAHASDATDHVHIPCHPRRSWNSHPQRRRVLDRVRVRASRACHGSAISLFSLVPSHSSACPTLAVALECSNHSSPPPSLFPSPSPPNRPSSVTRCCAVVGRLPALVDFAPPPPARPPLRLRRLRKWTGRGPSVDPAWARDPPGLRVPEVGEGFASRRVDTPPGAGARPGVGPPSGPGPNPALDRDRGLDLLLPIDSPRRDPHSVSPPWPPSKRTVVVRLVLVVHRWVRVRVRVVEVEELRLPHQPWRPLFPVARRPRCVPAAPPRRLAQWSPRVESPHPVHAWLSFVSPGYRHGLPGRDRVPRIVYTRRALVSTHALRAHSSAVSVLVRMGRPWKASRWLRPVVERPLPPRAPPLS